MALKLVTAMNLNRRFFLAALASGAFGGAVAHTLDLDRLLWVPGAKRFFLPPVNQFVTVDYVCREFLAEWTRQIAIVKALSDDYDRDFPVSGTKIGDVINVRLPKRYLVATG